MSAIADIDGILANLASARRSVDAAIAAVSRGPAGAADAADAASHAAGLLRFNADALTAMRDIYIGHLDVAVAEVLAAASEAA